MNEYICIFDCETILDTFALKNFLDEDEINSCKNENNEIDKLKLSKLAMQKQEAKTSNSFLPINFHQIVCISAVIADKFGKFLKVNTINEQNEEEIIKTFLNFIQKYAPRLVSYNGRGFDLPLIMLRAMKYNLSVPLYFSTNGQNTGKNIDKWKNYRSRYDDQWALDLLDYISDFRAVSGLKLDSVCTSLGLPGKYDIHGDQVLELYYNNEFDKISQYCQSDTLNTYWLFLKYELLKGNITRDDYFDYLDIMSKYLLENKKDISYTKPFCDCIQEEFKRFNVTLKN